MPGIQAKICPAVQNTPPKSTTRPRLVFFRTWVALSANAFTRPA